MTHLSEPHNPPPSFADALGPFRGAAQAVWDGLRATVAAAGTATQDDYTLWPPNPTEENR